MFTHDQLQSLNKLEFKVYNYVINNKDKVPSMTIRELSEQTKVSPTVILRFCEKMNCKGYSDFKQRFKLYAPEQPKSTESLPDINVNYFLDFFNKINDKKEQEKLDEAAKIIADANRIIFFGLGASGMLAGYGSKHLTYMSKISQYIDDPFFSIHPSELKSTVIVVLSVSGETSIIHHVKKFKESNTTIIAITNSKTNTVARMANICLSYDFPMEMTIQNGMLANITSQVAVVYMLEAIGRKVQRILTQKPNEDETN